MDHYEEKMNYSFEPMEQDPEPQQEPPLEQAVRRAHPHSFRRSAPPDSDQTKYGLLSVNSGRFCPDPIYAVLRPMVIRAGMGCRTDRILSNSIDFSKVLREKAQNVLAFYRYLRIMMCAKKKK